MGLLALLLQSCKDEAFGPTIGTGTAPSITAPAAGTAYTFLEADAANAFPEFTWTAATYGFDAGITYTLQMDKPGNNFADPVSLGIVNGLKFSGKTILDINNALIGIGLAPDVEHNIEFRVVAHVAADVADLVSATHILKIKPYEAYIEPGVLQVPGDYQGWNPGDTTTVIYSLKNNQKYDGFAYFATPAPEFKYTVGKSWDVNYGDDGANGTLESGGANIKPGAPGQYRLEVNLVEKTHVYTKTDWGLIGSSTPDAWASDQNMTYDVATGEWKITLDLIVGEIKFRANDDWAINFGDDGANGDLQYGGANIAIAEAGNYTIRLKLSGQLKYTYTVQKN